MKLLAIAETFFPERPTGLARVAWDVCRELVHRRHEVHLLCPSSLVATDFDFQELEGVRVCRFRAPTISGFDPRNPWIRVRAYRQAIEACGASNRWDVIHCHGIYGVAAAMTLAPRRVPIVHSIHSPALEEQKWNWTHEGISGIAKLPGLPLVRYFEEKALAGSAVCHTLSEYTRHRVERLYPASAMKRWAVIPHWIDESWQRTHSRYDARRQLGWRIDMPVVLSVRQLRSRYGLDDAIRALAGLITAGRCEFRIVGDGALRAYLECIATGLGIKHGVMFEGFLSEKALRLAYQAADVFLLPTRALECFGLIAQEAMAVGLPVVATCDGAIPEILAPIMPQLLVPPGAESAIAGRVSAVLERRVAVPEPSTIIEHVVMRFSRQRLGDAYEKLFLSLTA